MSRKPLQEVSTRPVKAVRRRATLGLLPPELLAAGAVHFVERKGGAMTANDYEVRSEDGAVVMDAESRLQVFRGWKYEFLVGGELRFSMHRSKHLLVLDRLEVLDAAGQRLGEFRQELTAFSVHFQVVDGRGVQRLAVQQPADEHRRFDVFRGDTLVAEISRAAQEAVRRPRRGQAVESFDLTFLEALDELDRVFCLVAALFVDRLYFSTGDSVTDQLVRSSRRDGDPDDDW